MTTIFNFLQNRVLVGLALYICLWVPDLARADFHIRSPDEIDFHELEIEHNGSLALDKNPDNRGATSETLELGTGANSWWHTEMELDVGRNGGPDKPNQIQGGTWENSVRLTEPGEGWADFGLYAEYSRSSLKGVSDDVLFGTLIQKDFGRFTHVLNLFLEKQIGPYQDGHGLYFSYAWQSRWNIWRTLSPAIETYGESGQIDHFDKFQAQQLIAGPVLLGSLRIVDLGKLKYEAGYLFGATEASPRGTIRWKAEIEMPF
jgi:hypothetical protein